MNGKIQSVFNIPSLYRLLQFAVSSRDSRRTYVETFVRPKTGQKVLDLGCGVGDILESLPNVEYTGFDDNPRCIKLARQRFGARGVFFQHRFGSESLPGVRPCSFDLIMANGLLHHLNDVAALALLRLAREALRPGGRLVSLDGCYCDNQSNITRYLLRRDRGAFVRTEPEYLRLARQVFSDVRATLRHDLMRIPYTHLILEMTRERLV